MKKAFTLSEVLITLGIIGVVACMTIPSLYRKHQNKALKKSLLKNYSVLQQALNMYEVDHGVRLTFESLVKDGKGFYLKRQIIPYLNVANPCKRGNCHMYNIQDYYKNYSKRNVVGTSFLDDGQFILNDGSMLFLEDGGFFLITVDINGIGNGPNALGHDLFTFEIDKKGMIFPSGLPETRYSGDFWCDRNSTNSSNGLGCTYKALSEKDYFDKLP